MTQIMTYFVVLVCTLTTISTILLAYFVFKKERPKEESPNQEKTTSPPNRICTSLSCDWTTLADDTLDGESEKKRIIIMKCNECGALDKTIESVTKQSKKTWKTIKEKTLPSAYEQLDDYQKMGLSSVPQWMFRKTYVLVQQCVETGEIRETIADNHLREKQG